MKYILKIGLPIIAVVLIVIGVQMHKKDAATSQSPLERQIMAQEAQEVTPAPATGNISDITASFESELGEESSLAKSTNNDGMIATSDTTIISNYGNTYDTNQF